MKRVAFGAALLACALASASAAESADEYFRSFELEFEGKLRSGAIADLDADGRLDVGVLLTSREDPTDLRLVTCLQGAEGFRERCTSFRFPPEARVFDVGDVDGVPGAELVVLTDTGVRLASFANGAFGALAPVHPVRTLFTGTRLGKTVRLRCLFDLDGAERLALILPTIEGPRILRHENGALRLVAQLESHAEVTYRLDSNGEGEFAGASRGHAAGTQARFTAPQTHARDFDGDGRIDVVTLQGKRLRVFLREPSGALPKKPSFEWDRSLLEPEEQDDPVVSESLVFADLDGDGASDLIATKWGSPAERTRIDRYLYFARDGLTYPEQPDQRVRTESVDRRLEVVDLDGNGRSDLVLPFFQIAVSQAVKVVTENAVKLQLRLYLMGNDRRYSQESDKAFARVDRRIALSYHIDVMGYVSGEKSLPGESFRPLVTLAADANGDGYPDLIADSGSDRLGIHWGNEAARYSSSPDLVIDHESALNYDLLDLNADGKSDIVTYHGPRDRTPARRLARRTGKRSSGARPRLKPEVPARGPVVKILLSR